MVLAVLIDVTLLLSSLVSAAVLLPRSTLPNNALLDPQTPASPLFPSIITNNSIPPPNVLRIQCDGTHYGRDLNPSSCLDVFHYVGKSDEQTTFAQRHTGRPNDIPLPLRILSNDGRCFVQPLLIRGAVTGTISSTQMGQAAYTLFQRCVVEKGLGGIAADVGGDNHLNVVIADNTPHVRCDKTPTPGPPWGSCLAIISDMVATQNRKVFGDKNQDPRVEVNLPYYFKAIDARCQVTVGITGKSTSATWYEIWEAMTALAAMCVRAHSKGGKAFGLGLRKNIFIEVSDENPDLSQSGAGIANVSASTPLLSLEVPNASSEVGASEWVSDPSYEVSTDLV